MNDMPSVLIISMASSTDRRALQKFQLERLGLAFAFMDATTTEEIPADELKQLQNRWARPLRDTEVACALSHRRAWAMVEEEGKPTLIIEDDVILASDLPAILQRLDGLKDYDCINLETYSQKKTLGKPSVLGVDGYTHAEVYRDSAGAAAYYLRPEAASKLLKGLKNLLPLADSAINLTLDLRKAQIEPACAIQVSVLAKENPIRHYPVRQSLIAKSKRLAPENILQWLRYKAIRVRISAILLQQNIRGLGKSTRRDVAYAQTDQALTLLKDVFPEIAPPGTL